MPTERWQRIEQLFTEALEQPPALRAAFLARACESDAAMQDEVSALLAAAHPSVDFLATPALDVFARQISREGWSVQPGDQIGSYAIGHRLGAGGMGEVWRAHDDRLERDVAIKLLLPHPTNADERVRAFEREARAAGTLNHANVLTVHDVGNHHGAPYLVTECLEGESLRARLRSGAVAVDAALDIAMQVARGLGAAHARGIVHRDLKPENVFLAVDGRVKILDFGLATLHDRASAVPGDDPLAGGTAGYMSPEQVRGDAVDQRADIFALGAVLFEMLTGRPPFNSGTAFGTLEAVLTREPEELSLVNPAVPPALARIVHRCLAKPASERFATVTDVEQALGAVVRMRNLPPPPGLLTIVRRPTVAFAIVVVILTLAAGAWRSRVIATRERWARTIAAPAVQRLANDGEYASAFLLARQALDVLPDDPQLKQIWLDVSIPANVVTDPPGADVAIIPYRAEASNWFPLGRTPLNGIRIPRALVRVRITKPGFQPIDGSMAPPPLRYRLDPVDDVPPGMVRVAGGASPIRIGLRGRLDDYWIDRFEVTNRQFKEFVDRGGYSQRDLWREPLIERNRLLPWDEAVARFRDATGRRGPATWTSGTYPEGQADFPVGGVSWYEAAAYAAFVGKSLPTIHHWYAAARMSRFADTLTASNFHGTGPAAVGSYKGLGPFGTYDMAGNVKEWCSTATDTQRFIAGGAWNEPQYMFGDYDTSEPFDRAENHGFRLVKYRQPPLAAVSAPVEIGVLRGQPRRPTPVSDAVFDVYRRQYAYDRTPLNAVVASTEETDAWVKQSIAFDAAYGAERMRAYVFLPRHISPPFQTVVFFPAADAFHLDSSHDMSLTWMNAIVGSGRAFLYPVYKGTYERSGPGELGLNAERELRIAWYRDLGRALDYLDTRSDIDRTRVGFYGVSAGADAGVILAALEPRLKTAIFQGTGLSDDMPPEIDVANYAPRVRIPVLMLNGRYDFETPFDTAQRPLFDLLGAAGENKEHRIFETGHALPMTDVARVILPWLDRQLGSISRAR